MSVPNYSQYVPVKQNNITVIEPVRDASPDETDIIGNE